jgi:hypothetical protein
MMLCFAAALGASQSARAFALRGPIDPVNEPWMATSIGYDPRPGGTTNFNGPEGLSSGPKNIGEEYRRNIPTLYYSFDMNFRQYFGAIGVTEASKAFDIFNAVTNVSSYSPDLSEFPTTTMQQNYTASALGLTDLKSTLLHLLTEQMGLAEPERYIWAIHERIAINNGGHDYFLIKRNFDLQTSAPNQFQSTSYVNGILYTFYVKDIGSPDQSGVAADALEVPVDPLAPDAFTAVASSGIEGGLPTGFFYNGLTRDDVGGLRYLLRTNNINLESAGGNVQMLVTNQPPLFLPTLDLNLFATQGLTNTDLQMQALYPGLIVSAPADVSFTNLVTTNITSFFQNRPGDPLGTFPAKLTFVTNITTTPILIYQHHFANVVTNTFSTHSVVISQTIVATNLPSDPVGSFPRIKTLPAVVRSASIISGDFFIMPAGFCGVAVSAVVTTNVIATTNSVLSGVDSNGVVTLNGQIFLQSTITFFTNHILFVNTITCSNNPVEQFEGVEKVNFVHVDDDLVDPLTRQYRIPITNEYTLTAFDPISHHLFPVRIRRIIFRPDILLSATDLTGGPEETDNFVLAGTSRDIPWNTTEKPVDLAGPGTIDSTVSNTVIAFNNSGPVFFTGTPNSSFLFTAEGSTSPEFIWGSFDASTNAPVVYPNGTSLDELFTQMLTTVSPLSLPEGTLGDVFDTTTFTTSATGPVTWSLAPGSPALPPGLTLSSGGTISGTPTQDSGVLYPALYDFVVRLTDGNGATVDRLYSITIHPQLQ